MWENWVNNYGYVWKQATSLSNFSKRSQLAFTLSDYGYTAKRFIEAKATAIFAKHTLHSVQLIHY